MAGAPRPETRPIAPHVFAWRWHVTMFSSIAHRVSGLALYGAAILFALWLLAAAAGPDTFAPVDVLLASWFGQLCLYLVVASLAYHFANGIRHLVFDVGLGLKPADANVSAWCAIVFAIAVPILLWAALNLGA